MSKFKIKLKLQGLELEVEGSREEDASMIGRKLGEQLTGLILPSTQILNGDVAQLSMPMAPAAPIDVSAKRRVGRRAKSTPGSSDKDNSQAIEFRHDSSRYGTPSQDWKTAQKAMWLLYVVKEVTNVSEMSTGQIFKTFNTHFRQAKTITNSNISRDLGKLKVANPSLVGEDTNKSPPAWYLTEEGVRKIQTLIAETLSSSGT